MKLRLFFAWYDIWVGAYWSQEKRTLYICAFPMICLSVQFGCNNKLWRCIEQALKG